MEEISNVVKRNETDGRGTLSGTQPDKSEQEEKLRNYAVVN
jgi:hypothetical protein